MLSQSCHSYKWSGPSGDCLPLAVGMILGYLTPLALLVALLSNFNYISLVGSDTKIFLSISAISLNRAELDNDRLGNNHAGNHLLVSLEH